jgi:hypothetical protein
MSADVLYAVDARGLRGDDEQDENEFGCSSRRAVDTWALATRARGPFRSVGAFRGARGGRPPSPCSDEVQSTLRGKCPHVLGIRSRTVQLMGRVSLRRSGWTGDRSTWALDVQDTALRPDLPASVSMIRDGSSP